MVIIVIAILYRLMYISVVQKKNNERLSSSVLWVYILVPSNSYDNYYSILLITIALIYFTLRTSKINKYILSNLSGGAFIFTHPV